MTVKKVEVRDWRFTHVDGGGEAGELRRRRLGGRRR
jgi:hypothetical protein